MHRPMMRCPTSGNGSRGIVSPTSPGQVVGVPRRGRYGAGGPCPSRCETPSFKRSHRAVPTSAVPAPTLGPASWNRTRTRRRPESSDRRSRRPRRRSRRQPGRWVRSRWRRPGPPRCLGQCQRPQHRLHGLPGHRGPLFLPWKGPAQSARAGMLGCVGTGTSVTTRCGAVAAMRCSAGR